MHSKQSNDVTRNSYRQTLPSNPNIFDNSYGFYIPLFSSNRDASYPEEDINYSSLFTSSQNSSYNYSSPQNRSTCGSAVDISSISFYCEDASADGHTSNTSYHYNTTSEIISFNYNKEQNAIKNQQKAASIQIPKRKHHLSNEAVGLMTEWFDSHVANPYPTLEKKELMASVGKITVKQVISWFSNRRNR